MTTARKTTANAAPIIPTVVTVGKVNEFDLLMEDLMPEQYAGDTTYPLLPPPYYGARVDVDPTYDKHTEGSGDSELWEAHKSGVKAVVNARQKDLCKHYAMLVKAQGPAALVIFVTRDALGMEVAPGESAVFPTVANVEVVRHFLTTMKKRGVRVQYV